MAENRMQLEFKKWIESGGVSNYDVVTTNMSKTPNPLVKAAVGFGANLLGSHGTSFKKALGSTLDGDSGHGASLANDLIGNFNVQGNFLKIDVIVPLPPDGNMIQAKQLAIKNALEDKTTQEMANETKANLNKCEIINTQVDQKNERVKFTMRFPIYLKTDDKVRYSYKNVKSPQSW